MEGIASWGKLWELVLPIKDWQSNWNLFFFIYFQFEKIVSVLYFERKRTYDVIFEEIDAVDLSFVARYTALFFILDALFKSKLFAS